MRHLLLVAMLLVPGWASAQGPVYVTDQQRRPFGPVLTTQTGGTTSGTVGTFTVAAVSQPERRGCTIQNTSSGILYVFFGSGVATTGASFQIGIGGFIICEQPGLVISNQIQLRLPSRRLPTFRFYSEMDGGSSCRAAPGGGRARARVQLGIIPGGYAGFQGLFGHKYVVPALQQVLGQAPTGQLNDLSGNPIGYLTVGSSNGAPTSVIQNGFPGFDGTFPAATLAYAAAMLEAGVPVVYGYFSDAHDHHYATVDGVNPKGSDFAHGSGEQGYVNQLKRYDQAFANLFSRLKADGIDETNTLFVILVEEGDKFADAKGVPAGCDGVTTPCTYPPIATTGTLPSKGEVDVNIDALLASQRSDATPFNVHTDQAPVFYLNGPLAQTDPVTRQFERDLAALTTPDAFLNNRSVPVLVGIANQAALSMLHMVTGDPLRTPTVAGFNYDDFYTGKNAVTTSLAGCAGQSVCTNSGFAWNHGGITAEVRQTWSSMVGPGVRPVGVDTSTWADHTDTRATMFALLGLQDSYSHDGRVIVENLEPAALPATIANNLAAYQALAVAYKQLTAPFGAASTAGLRLATAAIPTGSASNDAAYTRYAATMQAYLAARNPLIVQIKAVLDAAAAGTGFDAGQAAFLTSQAVALTDEMVAAAPAD